MLPPSFAAVFHENVPDVATFEEPSDGEGEEGVVGFFMLSFAVIVIGLV